MNPASSAQACPAQPPIDDWRQLARSLFATLRPEPRMLFADPMPSKDSLPDLLAQAGAGASRADLLPAPEIDAALAAGEDPFRIAPDGSDRPAQRPRPGPLQAVLRLSRHFGSQAALEDALFAPGRFAIVIAGDAALADAAEDVIEALGQRPRAQPRADGTRPRPRVLSGTDAFLAPTRGGDTGGAFRDLAPKLRLALESDAPIVVVVARPTDLPGAADHLHPLRIALPPLDAEILLEHLRHSHSATGRMAEALLRPHLPDAPALAALPFEALLLALRAPQPADVARGLARAARPAPRAPGGTLAEFPLPDRLRTQVGRIVADLVAAREGRLPHDQVTRGALLSGPPGSGKSELAQLIAEAAGVPFHATTLAAMQSAGRYGDFLREMRRTFETATASAPSVLFLDELDAVGDRARPQDHNSAYTDSVVCALLAQLDGAGRRPGVVVLAATNHPGKVDAALLRPGRFDHRLRIDQPSPELIPAAIRYQLRGALAEADLGPVAAAAVGMSGADLALLVRDARALARAADRPLALEDLAAALAALRPPLPAALRRRVALHESGHAIVAALTGHARPRLLALHAGGGTAEAQLAPSQGSRSDLTAALAVLMAGRAAERLALGTASAGAGGPPGCDLAQATRLCLGIEASLGLGTHSAWLGAPDDLLPLLRRDPALRRRVQALLDAAEAEAERLLAAHRPQLLALAEALQHAGLLCGPALETHLAGLGTAPASGPLAASTL